MIKMIILLSRFSEQDFIRARPPPTNKKAPIQKDKCIVINICVVLPAVITFFAMKSFIKISAEYSKKIE